MLTFSHKDKAIVTKMKTFVSKQLSRVHGLLDNTETPDESDDEEDWEILIENDEHEVKNIDVKNIVVID